MLRSQRTILWGLFLHVLGTRFVLSGLTVGTFTHRPAGLQASVVLTWLILTAVKVIRSFRSLVHPDK